MSEMYRDPNYDYDEDNFPIIRGDSLIDQKRLYEAIIRSVKWSLMKTAEDNGRNQA